MTHMHGERALPDSEQPSSPPRHRLGWPAGQSAGHGGDENGRYWSRVAASSHTVAPAETELGDTADAITRIDSRTGPEPVAPKRSDSEVEDVHAARRAKLAMADAWLAEAHDEAQSIVTDAVEQAALIAARAEAAADQVLLDARGEAEQVLSAAQASARVLREQADAIVAAVRRGTQDQRDQRNAELARERADHDDRLLAERAAFAAGAAALKADAEHHAQQQLLEAQAQAERLIEAARRQVEEAQLDADTARAQARVYTSQLLEAARETAARELAAVAEQTEWTQHAISGLLAAAGADAERVRRRAHLDAAAAVRRTRVRAATIVATARHRLSERLDEIERERLLLAERARQAVAQADADAERIRAQAHEQAARTLAEAEEVSSARVARAERRMAEAEAGARTVRERVADDLVRAQREAQDLRRTAKDQAITTVAAARAEADQLRSAARALLVEARAEVAALTAHRNAIADELGNLSGVIDALAVAEAPAPAAPVAPPTTSRPRRPTPYPHR